MRAAGREASIGIWIGSGIRWELPEDLLASARAVLGPLLERLSSLEPPSPPAVAAMGGSASVTRVEPDVAGWRLEYGCSRELATSREAVLLRLQEIAVEAEARRREWLLFRGSLVTRGSQCVLIVGDQGEAHVLLAIALGALEFHPVTLGLAAFDSRSPRGCLAPLSLPLAFPLACQDQAALQALLSLDGPPLLPLSPVLFRAGRLTTAPEPTHVLFPVDAPDPRSLVRPISATAARARLCGALTVAPDNPPPFAAVAALLRHTRGIQIPLGELSRSLEQLARLLPCWRVD